MKLSARNQLKGKVTGDVTALIKSTEVIIGK